MMTDQATVCDNKMQSQHVNKNNAQYVATSSQKFMAIYSICYIHAEDKLDRQCKSTKEQIWWRQTDREQPVHSKIGVSRLSYYTNANTTNLWKENMVNSRGENTIQSPWEWVYLNKPLHGSNCITANRTVTSDSLITKG